MSINPDFPHIGPFWTNPGVLQIPIFSTYGQIPNFALDKSRGFTNPDFSTYGQIPNFALDKSRGFTNPDFSTYGQIPNFALDKSRGFTNPQFFHWTNLGLFLKSRVFPLIDDIIGQIPVFSETRYFKFTGFFAEIWVFTPLTL